MNPTHDPLDPEALASARIAARSDTNADWAALDRVAATDPAVWARLAETLRDDAALRRSLAPAFACAEAVVLPAPPRARVPWLVGVAAAACAAWWLSRSSIQPAPAYQPAAVAQSAPADAPLPELPRLVVDARPTADGRATEVVYLRRTFERAVVDRVVEVGVDEYGQPLPRLVDAASLHGPQRF
jgi:hypothetical protein